MFSIGANARQVNASIMSTSNSNIDNNSSSNSYKPNTSSPSSNYVREEITQ